MTPRLTAITAIVTANPVRTLSSRDAGASAVGSTDMRSSWLVRDVRSSGQERPCGLLRGAYSAPPLAVRVDAVSGAQAGRQRQNHRVTKETGLATVQLRGLGRRDDVLHHDERGSRRAEGLLPLDEFLPHVR